VYDACICIDHGFYNEFHAAAVRAAREPHKCGECGDVIKPGDRYERVAGKCDGYWFTAKTCLVCARVRDDLFTCGYIYGEVWEGIHEMYCTRYDDEEDDEEDGCMCP